VLTHKLDFSSSFGKKVNLLKMYITMILSTIHVQLEMAFITLHNTGIQDWTHLIYVIIIKIIYVITVIMACIVILSPFDKQLAEVVYLPTHTVCNHIYITFTGGLKS